MTASIPSLKPKFTSSHDMKMDCTREKEESIDATQEMKVSDSPGDHKASTSSTKLDARLARNRTTARLRRERKKMQADTLTHTVQSLSYHLEMLNNVVAGLQPQQRVVVEQLVEARGPPPLACEYCDQLFWVQASKEQHQLKEHAAELKVRMAMQAEESKLAAELRKYDGDGSSKAAGLGENSVLLGKTGPQVTSKLTPEERRRRRLERNAASARLCRQRKKMYIENMRTQVPVLKHKIEALRSSLPEVGVPVSTLPKPDYSSIDASLRAAQLGSLSSIDKSSVMSTSSDEASHSANVSPMSPAFMSSDMRGPVNNDFHQLQHLQQRAMPALNLGGISPFQQMFPGSLPAWSQLGRAVRSSSASGASECSASGMEQEASIPALSRVRAATIGEGISRKRRSDSDVPMGYVSPSFLPQQSMHFSPNLMNSMLALRHQQLATGSGSGAQSMAGAQMRSPLGNSEGDAHLQQLLQQQQQLLMKLQGPSVAPATQGNGVAGLKKPRCSDPDVLTAAMALFECASVVSPQQ